MHCLILILLTILPGHPLQEHVQLDLEELNESSGVATSTSGKVVWTHNDSGDGPRLFAFTRQGEFLAQVHIGGAKARDWEDMCSFTVDGQDYLAVGDIGDNNFHHEDVSIYVIQEPSRKQLEAHANKTLKVRAACRLTVQYPGESINCEALAWDPIKKVFVLATKENLRCRLFEVDGSKLDRDLRITAQWLQTVALPLVTGADISRDGKQLVLSTYGPGALLTRNGNNTWQSGEQAKMFAVPHRRQGESICFTDQDATLLLTSEFTPCPLFEVS